MKRKITKIVAQRRAPRKTRLYVEIKNDKIAGHVQRMIEESLQK